MIRSIVRQYWHVTGPASEAPGNSSDRRSETVPGPLSVEADLSISLDGYDYQVSGAGDRLVITAPSIPAALALLRSVPDAGNEPLQEILETADLVADVRVRGTHVASLGAGVEPGLLSRPLGGPPAHVRTGGAAVATGRELRARPLALAGITLVLIVLRWLLSGSQTDDSSIEEN
ncbi:hypothetical protein BRC91_06345 [Halobacteriales archaeon QS_4_62_28]|nr:MAG: hypothetical protein BRC91_06345 [Halobacteriales archaeon QS_4_62_28]